MTPILILAAGSSSRMSGKDKLLQEIDGKPLLQRTVRRAVATGNPVFVAIPGPWHPRYALLRREQVACFDVPDSKEGVGGTLRGAVKRLPPCDAFLVMLADMPDLETGDLLEIIYEKDNHRDALIIRASTEAGKLGHPILFDASLRPAFAMLRGDRGAAEIVTQHKDQMITVALKGERARFDLDTPEDWQTFEDRQVPAISG